MSCRDFLEKQKQKVLELISVKQEFQRGDYLEFTELCRIFLTFGQHLITFKLPGALHKAKWMGKLLYSIKICLLEKHIETLPPGTVVSSAQQASKIRSFANFATLIYSQWWLTCPSAVDAPWNDLELYKNLSHYSLYDKHVSNSALKALRRHLWYLTEEMIPLALFSDVAPAEEKRTIAKRLLEKFGTHSGGTDASTKRYGSGFGKAEIPRTS